MKKSTEAIMSCVERSSPLHWAPCIAVLILTRIAFAEPACTTYPHARYRPVDAGYQIVNSSDVFNRSLYGGHAQDNLSERYFTLAGDRPLVMGALINIHGGGSSAKCGTFMMGVATTPGLIGRNKYGFDNSSQWFHKSGSVVATFSNGWMDYGVAPVLQLSPQVKAWIEVLPLNPDDGFLVHFRVWSEGRNILVMGFGGITDYVGLLASTDVEVRNFRPEDCKGNAVTLGRNRATIKGPLSTMRIGTNLSVEVSMGDAKRVDQDPGAFLSRQDKPGDTPMVRMSCTINPGQTLEGFVVAIRNADEQTLDEWLAKDKPADKVKARIRDKLSGIEVHTPDPMLDLTVPPNVIGMDACWNQSVFCHGGTHWHSPYLGWRNWYGPTVIGWHDRVATCFKTHAARLMIDQKHGDGCIPDNLAGRSFGYNMQEVAIDMFLHHLEWTGDLNLARKVFDTVSRVLAYEERVFDPEGDGLYRNQLNTWVSDAHWYNGGNCAQASAYNYRANRLMALIARKIGKNAAPFEVRAARIRSAMQDRLWLPAKGVLAEYIDTVGNKLIHPSPELATIYHAIECDAVDSFQAYQMLRFTETDIRNERTTARNGRLAWSSNWYPNHFSDCGLFPGENMHLAWAYFANGQERKGTDLLTGVVDAHFLGKTPGVVGHCMNGTGFNAGALDFADTISMHLRLIVEGLFGIRFKLLEGRVEIAPNFPPAWDRAELKIPDISLSYRRSGDEETLNLSGLRPATRVIKLPMRSTRVGRVTLNGQTVKYGLEPHINRAVIVVETGQAGTVQLMVHHGGTPPPTLEYPMRIEQGAELQILLNAGDVKEWKDPSGSLAEAKTDGQTLRAKASGTPGAHTVFIHTRLDDWDGWLAADFTIQPERAPKRPEPKGIFQSVDISRYFNVALADIHSRDFERPRGADGVAKNGRSRWDDAAHGGAYKVVVKDEALRGCGGTFKAPSGIPFATPSKGPNALCVSLWENFPKEQSIPLSGRATEVAVLLIGSTNPMQAWVDNAQLVLTYADGSSETLGLINPRNFDDWLNPAAQTENETVYFSDYNHAIVQRTLLDPAKELKGLTVRAVANEVIVGVLGVSLRKE